MDNSENKKIYKTLLCQRLAYYNYAKKNRDKVNTRFNNYYNTNENYRLYKIEQ